MAAMDSHFFDFTIIYERLWNLFGINGTIGKVKIFSFVLRESCVWAFHRFDAISFHGLFENECPVLCGCR